MPFSVYPIIERQEEKMKDLSDEEYARLDEKWTKTAPNVGPNGTGFFAQRNSPNLHPNR